MRTECHMTCHRSCTWQRESVNPFLTRAIIVFVGEKVDACSRPVTLLFAFMLELSVSGKLSELVTS